MRITPGMVRAFFVAWALIALGMTALILLALAMSGCGARRGSACQPPPSAIYSGAGASGGSACPQPGSR